MSTETKIVQVVAEGDSLFGKFVHFVEEVGEHVVVDIETEVGKIRRFIHKDAVKPAEAGPVTKTLVGNVTSSTVATEAIPGPLAASETKTTPASETAAAGETAATNPPPEQPPV